MSDKQMEILGRIATTVPKLDKDAQNYILGMADGMALANEMSKKGKTEDDGNTRTETRLPGCTE